MPIWSGTIASKSIKIHTYILKDKDELQHYGHTKWYCVLVHFSLFEISRCTKYKKKKNKVRNVM